MSTLLPPKNVGATVNVALDFTSRLDPGETIVGVVIIPTTYSGIDPTPMAILSGVAAIAGPIVNQTVTGGLKGVIYLLSCTVTTSLGALKNMISYLAVLDTNPYQP